MTSSLAIRHSVPEGVELLRWPEQQAVRRALERANIPRILVLAPDTTLPSDVGDDEDWVREPLVDTDVRRRAERLLDALTQLRSSRPWIDGQRVLHRGHRTVLLTPSEVAAVEPLLASRGHLVGRAVLEGRIWGDAGVPSDRALDAVLYRLRQRCAAVGLRIDNVRGEGFVMVSD